MEKKKVESATVDYLIDCIYLDRTNSFEPKLMLATGSHNGIIHLSEVVGSTLNPKLILSSPYGHKECIRSIRFIRGNQSRFSHLRVISGGEDSLICDWGINFEFGSS